MKWEDIDGAYIIHIFKDEQRLQRTIHELYFLAKIVPLSIHKGVMEQRGCDGLRKTMVDLFKKSIESNKEHILVFEDDAKFILNDGLSFLHKSLKQLPNDYNYLKLGCNLLMAPEKYGENVFKLNGSYATHAVLYSRKCMEKVLEINSEDPFDVILAKHIEPLGKSYCTNPMLVTQQTGVSDIFEYDAEKHKSINGVYYNSETKEIDWDKLMQERWQHLTKNIN